MSGAQVFPRPRNLGIRIPRRPGSKHVRSAYIQLVKWRSAAAVTLNHRCVQAVSPRGGSSFTSFTEENSVPGMTPSNKSDTVPRKSVACGRCTEIREERGSNGVTKVRIRCAGSLKAPAIGVEGDAGSPERGCRPVRLPAPVRAVASPAATNAATGAPPGAATAPAPPGPTPAAQVDGTAGPRPPHGLTAPRAHTGRTG